MNNTAKSTELLFRANIVLNECVWDWLERHESMGECDECGVELDGDLDMTTIRSAHKKACSVGDARRLMHDLENYDCSSGEVRR